jgi:hypothetical protein
MEFTPPILPDTARHVHGRLADAFQFPIERVLPA